MSILQKYMRNRFHHAPPAATAPPGRSQLHGRREHTLLYIAPADGHTPQPLCAAAAGCRSMNFSRQRPRGETAAACTSGQTARSAMPDSPFRAARRTPAQRAERQVVAWQWQRGNKTRQNRRRPTAAPVAAHGRGMSKVLARKSNNHADFCNIFANFAIVETTIQPLPI